MGWIAGVASLVGGLASAYGASQKSSQTSLPASSLNAYGQFNTPNTGAITSMNNIFDTLNSGTLNSQATGASQNYANSLNAAATNPLLAQGSNYLSNELAGGDLNSPQVNNYANQAYNSIISQGANQNARTAANYANNGLGFSTAMNQAQQAGNAATANTAATTRAGILSNNYEQQRQLQQGAIGLSEGEVAQPATYLGQINNALYAPYNSQASLTTGLLGSPTNNPQNTYVQQPGLGQALSSGVSTASGLNSLFNNLNMQSGYGSDGNTGTPTGTTNGISDSSAVFCWVAREIYGHADPRWLKFREWVVNHSPIGFFEDYVKNGPWWAELVKLSADVRIAVQAFMDFKIAV
jgi:hypothetical protein